MNTIVRKSLFLTSLLILGQFSIAQLDTVRLFMFGHSLMDHRPPLISTPSDETTIAHWMSILADAANNEFSATGEFGFMGSHAANLPPDSQWGYDTVQTSWDASTTPLSQANIDQVMLTPLNYVQWQAANINYQNSIFSPLSASRTVMDYMAVQLPDSPRMYIYEHWPDMSSVLGGGSFPPNATQLANFHLNTQGSHHTWFLEFQDSLVASRPAIDVKMIPVGPVLTQILTRSPYNAIPVTELYEDDAPHGRASLYFLAGLVTYMGLYEEKAPSSYIPPTIVHSTIRNNYNTIVDLMWAQLQNFNYPNGESRVFFGANLIPLVIDDDVPGTADETSPSFHIYPNPSNSGMFRIDLPNGEAPQELVVYNMNGQVVYHLSKEALGNNDAVQVGDLPKGIYNIQVQGIRGVYTARLVLD
ncbi:MAG: T9SS type A sorting domain-containing protein [Bacteroidia bacterium]